MTSEENLGSSSGIGSAPKAPTESPSSDPTLTEASEIGNLFADLGTPSAVTPGQVVQGKVLKVTEEEVLVDIGLKCESAIPRREFLTVDGRLTVSPGDLVDVWIDRYDEEEGTVSISHEKASRLKRWEEIERAFREQETLRGCVVERVKGGLIVDIGVRAFLPGSHADLRPLRNLDSLKGHDITCKILKVNRNRDNVVVSRKLAMEEDALRRKTQLLEKLHEGAELVGRVKNLTDYGVFVDLGGMDGLLHITDLTWGRLAHPSEVVQVGQEIKVKVLKHDAEKGRVSLGLKQLSPDPWEQAPSAYHVGDRVTGCVVSITDYGAFVELGPGVDGLIHISEMTWSKKLKHPSKIVNRGDRVEAIVLDVNAAQRRISLSLKQTLTDPWATVGERFTVGSVVEGKVGNLTDFGAFVEIQEGVDGLIRLSDLSWTRKVKHPSEMLKKGQKIDAVILGLDPTHRRLSLGLKQLQPDVWDGFFSKTQVGGLVRGKVSRMATFGAFVELEEGIEGLCHISEVDEDDAGRGRRGLEVGNELLFRVIRLNPMEKRIGLSLKRVEEHPAPPRAGKEKEAAIPSTMAQALSSAGVTAPQPSVPAANTEN